MLNIERIDALIDHLRRIPAKKFYMGDWLDKQNECGTVGCIAGWASYLFEPEKSKRWLEIDQSVSAWDLYRNPKLNREYERLHPEEVGRKTLGLTRKQAEDLFFMGGPLWDKIQDKHPDWSEKCQAIWVLTQLRNEAAKKLVEKVMGDPQPVSLFEEEREVKKVPVT